MKIEEHNTLVDKAKNKKDGIYSYKGYIYLVKNNNFHCYADYSGNIYMLYGMFSTQIGKCDHYDRRKTLSKYLKGE